MHGTGSDCSARPLKADRRHQIGPGTARHILTYMVYQHLIGMMIATDRVDRGLEKFATNHAPWGIGVT